MSKVGSVVSQFFRSKTLSIHNEGQNIAPTIVAESSKVLASQFPSIADFFKSPVQPFAAPGSNQVDIAGKMIILMGVALFSSQLIHMNNQSKKNVHAPIEQIASVENKLSVEKMTSVMNINSVDYAMITSNNVENKSINDVNNAHNLSIKNIYLDNIENTVFIPELAIPIQKRMEYTHHEPDVSFDTYSGKVVDQVKSSDQSIKKAEQIIAKSYKNVRKPFPTNMAATFKDASKALAEDGGFNDKTTEMATKIHPDLIKIMARAKEISKIDFDIVPHTGGLRTKEMQQQLKRQGASMTSRSKHLLGLAIDIVPMHESRIPKFFDKKSFLEVDQAMKQAAKEYNIAMKSGNDFKGFVDLGHFELDVKVYEANNPSNSYTPDVSVAKLIAQQIESANSSSVASIDEPSAKMR